MIQAVNQGTPLLWDEDPSTLSHLLPDRDVLTINALCLVGTGQGEVLKYCFPEVTSTQAAFL